MESTIQDWLGQLCGKITGVRSALILLAARPGQSLPAAVWPADSRPPTEVYTAARDTLLGDLAVHCVSPSTTAQYHIFSLPLRLANWSGGAFAIAVDPAEAAPDDIVLGTIRPAVAQLHPLLAMLQPANPGSSEALRLTAALLAHDDVALACTAFANEVASIFRCHRASVGLLQGGHVAVVATSHGSGRITPGEAFNELEAAMEEAVDQGTTVQYPLDKDARALVVLAHTILARGAQESVMTVPLVVERQMIGAITLESPSDAAFNEDEKLLLEHLVGLLAPLVVLKQRASESAWQRGRSSLARYWSQLRAPGMNRCKLVGATVAGLFLLLTALPVPYRVTAPARVEGEVQRVLAAPNDGFLHQVHARPGDEVKHHQVLVELAQENLLLEQRKWQSELAQHENAYGAAMAKGDRTQLAVSMARMQEAQAQLGLVEQQLARSRLNAPFDGIVTEGDLAQSLGSPVKKGQILMTIAPRGRYRIVVEVDEIDIRHVENGQSGSLTPTARPGDSQNFFVSRITPVATVIDTRNVFEVEGALHGGAPMLAATDFGASPAATGTPAVGVPAAATNAERLRPGMRGVAKIAAGYRPLGWILFYRLANWARLNLWRWGF
ncbi:MAG: efflux RND transporter periplasmic adaptor subunit [Candidatus Accumulibacter sp.]|uniref:efflux RND transporter periplasmic adaptor subunit n=1 Tax=Accumulibacter sp. TaxID=2053492 RepID=UPI002878C930|nr:efflux RND transporter periplasmic adaptor subunit [Accumulibacter sp.]MDS4013852.1 efflux RND transporter periplasmic adaptor subunit [Accumulibacter sp.]